MSWLRCDSCDALIDTDQEPGAYDAHRDVWLCADCRPVHAAEWEGDPGRVEQHERDCKTGDRERFEATARRKKWNTPWPK